MSKPFLYIYRFFLTRRKLFFLLFVLWFLVTGYFSFKVKAEEDISGILPRDTAAAKLGHILSSSPFADKLVLLVSLKDSSKTDPRLLAGYADSFLSRLIRDDPEYVVSEEKNTADSLYPALLSLVYANLPVFLESGDYARIDSLTHPARVREALENDLHQLGTPSGMVLKNFIARDPLGLAYPVLQRLQQLRYDDNFEIYGGYPVTKDHRYLLVFIRSAFPPDNTGKNTMLIRAMEGIRKTLDTERFNTVDAAYFGAPAVAAGNAAQLRRDSLLTVSITAVFFILFLGWYFRKKTAPLIVLIPVISGLSFSLALIWLIQGSISVIALAAGSVVLGIAINYSLHVYNHFRHRGDMETVIRDLTFPLTIGSLTTIGGFLSLQFVHSAILKDLGLFAGFSLIGASLSSLVFLPHLIAPARSGEKKIPGQTWIEKFSHYHPEKNKWLVAIIFAVTGILAFYVHRTGFDEDMMHLNYMPDGLRTAEATLNRINSYSLRSVYLINEAVDPETALRRQESLDRIADSLIAEKKIRKYTGIFKLVMSDSLQQKKIRDWNLFWTDEKKKALEETIRITAEPLGFSGSAFSAFSETLGRSFHTLDTGDMNFLKQNFATGYFMTEKGKTTLVSLLKAAPDDKKDIYAAFAGLKGVTVADRQWLATRLLDDVRADFGRIGWMTSILVFVVLLLTYGRIELTLVSFIPMVVAFIWILGIMGLAGLSFNIVNIILSALIFGLGDDYSLFIMDGLLQEYKTGKKNLSSYKSSIVLSAITTLAGLGVLIFARHPALRSIALISITGILSVVLVAQVLIPYFFNFLIRNRIRRGRFPWTAAGLIKSVFSLSYFAFGSLLVTGFGYVLVKWNLFRGPRSRYIYHRMLSSYTWSVLYIMTNVKKKIINPDKEDFSKPCVLIANHQSFLDILVMTMLYPKVVLLTNEWVWKSPLFGKLVRMAGYYRVADGIENSIEYLREQVRQGYSIAVFPEGTRTPDGRIKRFHKGAFYIAEKLQLDILPVMIHGTGYTMSKSDFLLKDGFISVKYLPRIKPGDYYFGTDYTERSKYLGRYFRDQYAAFSKTCERPRFYREQLIYNFLYKGPVLEWYLRVKIRLENDYQIYHELIPKEGRVLDIGCGYGFISYMLHFAARGRDLTGYDYDEEKIATAEHCFSRDEHIRFLTADITRMQFSPADAIILSDILHYLEPSQQESLMLQCMESLRPGGILLVREGDRDVEKKHEATRMTEFFSTKFFAFNKTEGKPLHFISGSNIRELAGRRRMHCRSLSQSGRTSNRLFIITHTVESYEEA